MTSEQIDEQCVIIEELEYVIEKMDKINLSNIDTLQEEVKKQRALLNEMYKKQEDYQKVKRERMKPEIEPRLQKLIEAMLDTQDIFHWHCMGLIREFDIRHDLYTYFSDPHGTFIVDDVTNDISLSREKAKLFKSCWS